jgi:hypothetical protein
MVKLYGAVGPLLFPKNGYSVPHIVEFLTCMQYSIFEFWIFINILILILFFSQKPDTARLGTQSLTELDDGYVDYKIKDLVAPPNYTIHSRYHDLLLISVDRTIEWAIIIYLKIIKFIKFPPKFRFNINLRPACLWHENTLSVSNAVASGWGQTAFGKKNRLRMKKLANIFLVHRWKHI